MGLLAGDSQEGFASLREKQAAAVKDTAQAIYSVNAPSLVLEAPLDFASVDASLLFDVAKLELKKLAKNKNEYVQQLTVQQRRHFNTIYKDASFAIQTDNPKQLKKLLKSDLYTIWARFSNERQEIQKSWLEALIQIKLLGTAQSVILKFAKQNQTIVDGKPTFVFIKPTQWQNLKQELQNALASASMTPDDINRLWGVTTDLEKAMSVDQKTISLKLIDSIKHMLDFCGPGVILYKLYEQLEQQKTIRAACEAKQALLNQDFSARYQELKSQKPSELDSGEDAVLLKFKNPGYKIPTLLAVFEKNSDEDIDEDTDEDSEEDYAPVPSENLLDLAIRTYAEATGSKRTNCLAMIEILFARGGVCTQAIALVDDEKLITIVAKYIIHKHSSSYILTKLLLDYVKEIEASVMMTVLGFLVRFPYNLKVDTCNAVQSLVSELASDQSTPDKLITAFATTLKAIGNPLVSPGFDRSVAADLSRKFGLFGKDNELRRVVSDDDASAAPSSRSTPV